MAPYSFLKSGKDICDQNILYIDIFIEEWDQMSCIEQYFENQKLQMVTMATMTFQNGC
jgi:hypothetical protein